MGLGSSTGRGRCSSSGKRALLISCKSILPKDVWSASSYEILLAQQLLQKFGFCQDRIRCITNKPSSKVDMLRSNMLKEGIDWLVDGAKPGDHLVFFFTTRTVMQLHKEIHGPGFPEARSESISWMHQGKHPNAHTGISQATVFQIASEFAGFIDLSAIMLPTLNIPGLLTLTFIYAVEACGNQIRLSKLIDLMEESAHMLRDSLTELLSIPLPEDPRVCVVPFVIQVLHAGELRVQFGQNKWGDIFMTVVYRGVSLRDRELLSRETRSVGSWQVGSSLPTVSCSRHMGLNHRILV